MAHGPSTGIRSMWTQTESSEVKSIKAMVAEFSDLREQFRCVTEELHDVRVVMQQTMEERLQQQVAQLCQNTSAKLSYLNRDVANKIECMRAAHRAELRQAVIDRDSIAQQERAAVTLEIAAKFRAEQAELLQSLREAEQKCERLSTALAESEAGRTRTTEELDRVSAELTETRAQNKDLTVQLRLAEDMHQYLQQKQKKLEDQLAHAVKMMFKERGTGVAADRESDRGRMSDLLAELQEQTDKRVAEEALQYKRSLADVDARYQHQLKLIEEKYRKREEKMQQELAATTALLDQFKAEFAARRSAQGAGATATSTAPLQRLRPTDFEFPLPERMDKRAPLAPIRRSGRDSS